MFFLFFKMVEDNNSQPRNQLTFFAPQTAQLLSSPSPGFWSYSISGAKTQNTVHIRLLNVHVLCLVHCRCRIMVCLMLIFETGQINNHSNLANSSQLIMKAQYGIKYHQTQHTKNWKLFKIQNFKWQQVALRWKLKTICSIK